MNELILHGTESSMLKELNKNRENSWLPQFCHFYYVFDLHLDWKIAKKTQSDNQFDSDEYIKKAVKELRSSFSSFYECQNSADEFWILIGGDITCDLNQLDMFFSEYCSGRLGEEIKGRTIFVPGNHELWSNSSSLDEVLHSLEEIVVKKHGVYLLNNAVIFCDRNLSYNMFPKAQNKKDGEIIEVAKGLLYENSFDMRKRGRQQRQLISEYSMPTILNYQEIINASDEMIKELANSYSETILCGIGFSGYNNEHNATTGLYRGTISTVDEDIKYSRQFEEVYLKINRVLNNNTVICFTHTQKENWNRDPYNSNWIYVNGHTHENVAIVNKKRRVYSDNQIGYKSENFKVKFFTKQYNTNPFRHYEDGIYEGISVFDYLGFYNSLGEGSSFKAYINYDLIMLKKHGIYMFMAKRKKDKKLFILSGGVRSKTEHTPEYYYDRMVNYYTTINKQLYPINSVLNEVSRYVKGFGGDGRIHGFIVDIDFWNHIYVDFIDQKLVPYFAYSMTNKHYYDSVEHLLEDHNVELLNKLLEMDTKRNIVKKESFTYLPVYDDSTELYGASRKMLNYQKTLKYRVIRSWNSELEIEPDELLITSLDQTITIT